MNKIKKVLLCLLSIIVLSNLLLSCKFKVTDNLFATRQQPEDSPKWVQDLDSSKTASQLFIVAGLGEKLTTATITMHEKDKEGNWKQILTTPGYVGKNGLCLDGDHVEGCGQTPMGIYRFNKAFGIADDPGCNLPYIKVNNDLYWSGDQRDGMRYNEMVSIKDLPDLDKESSEHLIDYDFNYQYCLNISFNEDGTKGKGSAIFLHCLDDTSPYTGGCVSIPENKMRKVMQIVKEDCVVVIDTMANLKKNE